jgi:hypothetical protein
MPPADAAQPQLVPIEDRLLDQLAKHCQGHLLAVGVSTLTLIAAVVRTAFFAVRDRRWARIPPVWLGLKARQPMRAMTALQGPARFVVGRSCQIRVRDNRVPLGGWRRQLGQQPRRAHQGSCARLLGERHPQFGVSLLEPYLTAIEARRSRREGDLCLCCASAVFFRRYKPTIIALLLPLDAETPGTAVVMGISKRCALSEGWPRPGWRECSPGKDDAGAAEGVARLPIYYAGPWARGDGVDVGYPSSRHSFAAITPKPRRPMRPPRPC